MMNNISFAKSNLFQDQDIQNMTHKSQLFLLMNGKYFNLLPNPLRKCKDINFKKFNFILFNIILLLN